MDSTTYNNEEYVPNDTVCNYYCVTEKANNPDIYWYTFDYDYNTNVPTCSC